jgi:hypothetical protein
MTEDAAIPTPDPIVETPKPLSKPRSVFPGLVAGGVLAAAMGFGLSAYLLPNGWQPVAPDTALAERLTAVENALAAAPKPDSSLDDRLAAVEAVLAQPNVDLAPRLEKLEAEIAALKARPVTAGGVDNSEAMAMVEAATKAAEEELAKTVAEVAETAKKAEISNLMARLETMAQDGQPFAEVLAALGDQGVTVPETLGTLAETGLPSLTQLQADFPEAARKALNAALRATPGEGWSDRFGTFLRSQTGARSLTPQEGSDPDAILSRAEAALAKGDLKTTLTELAALPPEAVAEMASWVEQATKRQQALDALAGWQP